MDKTVAIIGGGPAGLMAAEVLSGQSVRVDVYDSMPSLGRKFYMSKNGEKVMVKIDGQKSQPMTIDDVKKILQKDEKIDYVE